MRCLVAGGSGTVGRAVVRALAMRGASVVFTYHRSQEVASALAGELAGTIALRLDLGLPEAIGEAVGEAVERLGGVDAFVQCAGVSVTAGNEEERPRQRLEEITPQAWSRMLEVNVTGTFLVVQRVVGRMPPEGGNLVIVGSLDRGKPVPIPAHYAASKGALQGMVQALAKELGPRGIRVNMVAPGLIEGGVTTRVPEDLVEDYVKHTGLRRLGRPEEIAALVAWLALDNTYVTGRTILADGAL